MSSIGLIIRQERINQNIKQTTLAEGICSTSYLSKIENNFTVPSEEVVKPLLQRLQIRLETISAEDEYKLIESLYSLYRDSIIKRDRSKIKETLEQYSIRKINFTNLRNFYSYNLYMFRLILILDEEVVTLQPYYKVLVKMEDEFDDKQKFIMYLNLGIYHHLNGEYEQSLQKLEKALSIMNHSFYEEWELADFYNVLSLAYFKQQEYFNAIHYATKSQNFYKDHLLFERAIDSYIVMGVAYKNMKNYRESEKYYNLAKKLAADYKLPQYNGMVFQNLGALYSIQHDPAKAIEYFKQSLQYKEDSQNSVGYLITIFSIIKEYSKQGNSEMVLHWCKTGLEKIQRIHNDGQNEFMKYAYHFNIYKHLHLSSDQLEQVLKKGISYFEAVHDDRHVQKYSILLANFYFKKNKFKAANLCYQKANEILFKQKSIMKWEDL